ncbi:hypothetical protein CLPU_4c01800 [Gottschalkia purinilytica]|uniref:Glutamate decarboxylase n=1 Tax=Gottschalkia purinilytica TaxID=1503 RepID=A0A0L0WCC8_GOTPU|nr:hypothetical protein [Gottschalkia purinilytica]KNF09134.1 hypothetical protein CLPU_4c01800 [Gottschalkia purinilytica]
MWTAVYVVEGVEEAKIIQRRLEEEGFLVKLKIFSKDSNGILYTILAPEFEAYEIHKVLVDLGY